VGHKFTVRLQHHLVGPGLGKYDITKIDGAVKLAKWIRKLTNLGDAFDILKIFQVLDGDSQRYFPLSIRKDRVNHQGQRFRGELSH
jgi:hypothetical protein